jgi:hypothetical protein
MPSSFLMEYVCYSKGNIEKVISTLFVYSFNKHVLNPNYVLELGSKFIHSITQSTSTY